MLSFSLFFSIRTISFLHLKSLQRGSRTQGARLSWQLCRRAQAAACLGRAVPEAEHKPAVRLIWKAPIQVTSTPVGGQQVAQGKELQAAAASWLAS